MFYEKLTDQNYFLFCAQHYDNSRYSTTEEFAEDLNRIKYIKKLLTRFELYGDLKERLILNHIIILNNCFGPDILAKILFLKMWDQMSMVKPFLVFLNILPDKVYNVGTREIIHTDEIPMHEVIVERLRNV